MRGRGKKVVESGGLYLELGYWLPADHLAYFIDDVVDKLDLCEVFASYEGTNRQPPATDALAVACLHRM